MEQEKETRLQAECSRELAQRIVRELTPAGVQVLGGSGVLGQALAFGRNGRWKRPAPA